MYSKIPSQWIKHLDFILMDIACMEIAFFAAYRGAAELSEKNLFEKDLYINLAVILLLLNILIVFFDESYSGILRRGYYKEFTSTVKQATYILAAALICVFLERTAEYYSRIIIALFWLFYVFLSYPVRLLMKRYVVRHRRQKKRNLKMYLVTDSKAADSVVANILQNNFSDLELDSLAILDCNLVGKKIHGITVTGNKDNVLEYIQKNWIDGVFFNCSSNSNILALIKGCTDMGLTVYLRIKELEEYGEYQNIEKMAGYTVLSCKINSMSVRDACVKRMIDVVGGIIGCAITLLLIVILGPLIKIKSPGPLIFSQTRVGRNGKKFKIYKFRSMEVDAEERKKELEKSNKMKDGLMFKMDDDPRIIKGIGQFIRDTSLDEFPQFFNVLKGDMSLVGTRPPTVDEWEKYSPHHRKRLVMKPGITGLWQVSGRSTITDFEKIVYLDTLYIRNWSLSEDFKILFKTVLVVLRKDGAM